MARAYVDEEEENPFIMVKRRNAILLRLASVATTAAQGDCKPQASLELISRKATLKKVTDAWKLSGEYFKLLEV